MKSNNEFVKLYGLITRALDTSINLRTNINSQVVTWCENVLNINLEGAQVVTDTLWGELCQIIMIPPENYPENFDHGQAISEIVLIDGTPVNVSIISSEVFRATDKEVFDIIYHIVVHFSLHINTKLIHQLPVAENAAGIFTFMIPIIVFRIMRDFRCEYDITWVGDEKLMEEIASQDKDDYMKLFYILLEKLVNCNYTIEQLSQGYMHSFIKEIEDSWE